jgi:hypothetical protein
MNTYILVERPGDDEEIAKYRLQFASKTDDEIRELSNKQKQIGIVGVHQQGLYIRALMEEFADRSMTFTFRVDKV